MFEGTNYDPSTVRYLDILGKINREMQKWRMRQRKLQRVLDLA
ncbi:MAG: hypothetical protein ACLURV_03355 [Gallintestinimicrobium sp.]